MSEFSSVHPAERDQLAPAKPSQRRRPHSRQRLSIGMTAGPEDRREQDHRSATEHRYPKLTGVVDANGGSGILLHDNKAAPRGDAAQAFHLGFPRTTQQQHTAMALQSTGNIARAPLVLLGNDEPLARHWVASSHDHSYSASR